MINPELWPQDFIDNSMDGLKQEKKKKTLQMQAGFINLWQKVNSSYIPGHWYHN